MRRLTSITRVFLLIFGLLVSAIICDILSDIGTAAAQTKEIKILAFGDSLTAGYQLPLQEAYPAQLEQILNSQGYKVQVTNAGVSGDTTGQGLKRIGWSLKNLPKDQKYDWVLLCLGANDGLRLMPLKDMEKNLIAMIDEFKKAGSQVALIGMRLPTNTDEKYRKDFETVYQRVAKKKKLPLYPFLLEGVAASEMLNLEDQIHPNSKGQKIVASNVAHFLIPLLKTK